MTETCYIAATIRHYSIQVRYSCTTAHSAVTCRSECPEYSHIAEALPPNNGGTHSLGLAKAEHCLSAYLISYLIPLSDALRSTDTNANRQTDMEI